MVGSSLSTDKDSCSPLRSQVGNIDSQSRQGYYYNKREQHRQHKIPQHTTFRVSRELFERYEAEIESLNIPYYIIKHT